MKSTIALYVRKALRDQRGQVLPWVALGFIGMLGMGGMSVDVGRAYVAHAQLQNYANAAVLAAAGLVYNTSSTNNATTEANLYSASAGDKNVNGALGTVNTSVWTVCLNSLQPAGATCSTTTPPPNAVRVVEKATVPTYFMKLFGIPQLNVAASATASMLGLAQPWNVAIVLDATGSMSTNDTNCGSNVTEFQCALNGIQAMLGSTNPCKSGATSCTNAEANFHVALFAFPEVSTASVTKENACSSFSTPSFLIYALPSTTATSYTPIEYWQNSNHNNTFTATYEVTYGASDADANGFVSDYYSPSTTNGLNTSSSIVKAITKCMNPIAQAGSGTGGLNGASTGGITYYASVIYAAQAALTAEAKLNPDTNNALIFLSDGQANVVSATADLPTSSTFTAVPSTAGLNTLTGTGLYPDTKDECQQAIIAAQAATKAGTNVYSVAYGSEQTGCYSGSGNTDTSLVATGKNAPFTLSQLTPCVTMENIASSLSNFYSDYNESGSGSTCQDSSHTVTSLADIFLSIASSFTQPRLIPNTAK
jgi:Flp pilus assembly protein TadG